MDWLIMKAAGFKPIFSCAKYSKFSATSGQRAGELGGEMRGCGRQGIGGYVLRIMLV